MTARMVPKERALIERPYSCVIRLFSSLFRRIYGTHR